MNNALKRAHIVGCWFTVIPATLPYQVLENGTIGQVGLGVARFQTTEQTQRNRIQ